MLQNMNKNTLIIVAVTILSLAIGWGIGGLLLDRAEDKEKHASYAALIPLIGIEEDDQFETIADKVRLFIFENTRYSDDADFREIWGDHPVIAKKIAAYANGEAEKRAPLECSARSGAFEIIMTALGYRVRAISVYQYDENYNAHSFSEVQNPRTELWHTQDPQFNIYWRMKETGERASMAQLIEHGFEDYEPCVTPDLCGWDNLPNREGHEAKNLKGHLGLASIKDYQKGTRPLFVNEGRFALSKPQSVKGELKTYCEHVAKNCRGEITIYSPE